MHTEGRLAIVRRHALLELGVLREFAVEEFLSSWVTVIRSLLGGPFTPREARVSYPRPRHFKRYAAILKCPVIFDAGVVELRFDAAYLDRLTARPSLTVTTQLHVSGQSIGQAPRIRDSPSIRRALPCRVPSPERPGRWNRPWGRSTRHGSPARSRRGEFPGSRSS